MPNQELINYIKQAKEAGQSDEKIKSDLRAAGWEEGNINEALGAVLSPASQPSSPVSPQPVSPQSVPPQPVLPQPVKPILILLLIISIFLGIGLAIGFSMDKVLEGLVEKVADLGFTTMKNGVLTVDIERFLFYLGGSKIYFVAAVKAIYSFSQIAVFGALIYIIIFMMQKKSKLLTGEISQEPLTPDEKIIIWSLSFLNPIVSNVAFYQGWHKVLPIKAKQSNNIAWSALLILLLAGIGAYWYFSKTFRLI